jgi:hypothetical protein
VNTAMDPAEVSLRLPMGVRGRAFVLGEDRELPAKNDTIHDRFGPYGVHSYRLKGA